MAVSCLFPGQGGSRGGPGGSRGQGESRGPQKPFKTFGKPMKLIRKPFLESVWPGEFAYGRIRAIEQIRNCLVTPSRTSQGFSRDKAIKGLITPLKAL